MCFIVVAPQSHAVQIGVAKPYPQATLPSNQLPLHPPLAFATAFILACANHLSLTKSQLASHQLVIATPSTNMTPRTIASLRHAARLLRMQIHFYPAYRCFTALAARPCTVLDIGLTHAAIFDQHRLHVVKIALQQVQQQFRATLQPLPTQQQLDHLVATTAVVAPSNHFQLGDVTADSYLVDGNVRKSAGDVFFTDDVETNLACCIARFLQSSHDVYARDRNRHIFCVGIGALPGISSRLQQEFASCRDQFGLKGVKLHMVQTQFEAGVVAWVGACVLAVAGQPGDDDEDRIG